MTSLITIENLHVHQECDPATLDTYFAGKFNELKELFMSELSDLKASVVELKREVTEQTAQTVLIKNSLSGLMAVIEPLMAAAASAQAALVAAQVQITALQAEDAAEDVELAQVRADIAAAEANLETAQADTQPLIDAAQAVLNP